MLFHIPFISLNHQLFSQHFANIYQTLGCFTFRTFHIDLLSVHCSQSTNLFILNIDKSYLSWNLENILVFFTLLYIFFILIFACFPINNNIKFLIFNGPINSTFRYLFGPFFNKYFTLFNLLLCWNDLTLHNFFFNIIK